MPRARCAQHPCLAAAALARRGADPARAAGRRSRDRDHDHADGCGSGYRSDALRCIASRSPRTTTRSPCTTGWRRLARAAVVARACATSQRGRARPHAAAGGRRDLRAQDRQGRDADIDWTQPRRRSSARYARCDPSPGARVTLRGEAMKIWRARCVAADTGAPGSGARERRRRASSIACGEGALLVDGTAARRRHAPRRRRIPARLSAFAVAIALAPLAESTRCGGGAGRARCGRAQPVRGTGNARPRSARAARRAGGSLLRHAAALWRVRRRSSPRFRAAPALRTAGRGAACGAPSMRSNRAAMPSTRSSTRRRAPALALQRGGAKGLRERAAAQFPARARRGSKRDSAPTRWPTISIRSGGSNACARPIRPHGRRYSQRATRIRRCACA